MLRDLADIDTLVIHCADTPDFRAETVQDIDAWHKARGFRRSAADRRRFNPDLGFIGYHFVIYVDGSVHTGRALLEVGAHATGFNRVSAGICLIGRQRYTGAQWSALAAKVAELRALIGAARDGDEPKVVGHTDLNPQKTCPGFDVGGWLTSGAVPPEALA